VGLEQLGYGFGFTAYMVYMLFMAQGEFKTSHFALCTGFMALGMMIPGMWSGFLQEITGYTLFFIIAVPAHHPRHGADSIPAADG
jgi:MFS transporter, PAT family, beta-lactamase induction signal transducer AmpG